MYTATIVDKKKVDDRLVVSVRFMDGTDTVLETITPQDRAGFNQWVKARVESLNSAKELEAEDNIDAVIDLSVPAVAEPTAEEVKASKYQAFRAELVTLKEDVGLGLATQATYDTELAKLIAWMNK